MAALRTGLMMYAFLFTQDTQMIIPSREDRIRRKLYEYENVNLALRFKQRRVGGLPLTGKERVHTRTHTHTPVRMYSDPG